MRKFALSAASVLTLAAAAPAFAAPNPAGIGQPNQSCEDQSSSPPGFNTGGFANAQQRYANPGSQGGTSSGNAHVVAQYDVACFQVSQH